MLSVWVWSLLWSWWMMIWMESGMNLWWWQRCWEPKQHRGRWHLLKERGIRWRTMSGCCQKRRQIRKRIRLRRPIHIVALSSHCQVLTKTEYSARPTEYKKTVVFADMSDQNKHCFKDRHKKQRTLFSIGVPFFNRSWRFMDAYRKGLTGKAAEWAVWKQKSHRTVSQSAMMNLSAVLN